MYNRSLERGRDSVPPKPKHTREQIIAAALELVSEKGMSDWPYLFGRSSSGETVMEKLNRKKKTIIPEVQLRNVNRENEKC